MKQVRRGSGKFNLAVRHEPYSVIAGKRIIDISEARARARFIFVLLSTVFIATGIFFMFF